MVARTTVNIVIFIINIEIEIENIIRKTTWSYKKKFIEIIVSKKYSEKCLGVDYVRMLIGLSHKYLRWY